MKAPLLSPVRIPGLLVLGTDTGVGKTVVTAAIGDWFRRRNVRVGACKPAATGCVHRREGLVSEDAEFVAHHGDVRFPLDVICPVRYVEPLAPAVAAERAKEPMAWEAIERSLQEMSRGSDVMLVEGVGGLMVPMDATHTFLDVAALLKLPAVVVARPGLGTINHTLLTLSALRQANVKVAGVVINRYPAENASVAEETNPRAIEKWGKAPILCIAPDSAVVGLSLPADIVAAFDPVDWAGFAGL